MATEHSSVEEASAPRKWLWAIIPVTAVALLQFVPAGADPSPRPDGTKSAASGPAPAAIGLPVAASQAGAWTVGVNSLPPVSGTVGVNSLPPVSGTIGVNSLPPVSGTVGVSSLPPVSGTVNIGNSSATPVPVQSTDAVPAETFFAEGHLINDNNCGNCGHSVLVEVPAGKVAVIETVSATFDSPVGFIPQVSLAVSDQEQIYSITRVALEYQGTQTFTHLPDRLVFAGTHQLRLYAPAGSIVAADFYLQQRTDQPNEVSGYVNVSGYFLPAPS